MQKRIFLLIVLSLFAATSKSQSLTFSIVTQPCNNNGVINVTTPSNFIPPISFDYTINNTYFTQVVSSGYTDILAGYSGANVFVSAYDNHGHSSYGSFNAYPFTITTQQTVIPTCPNPGQFLATVTGGTPPYTYVWKNKTTGLTVSTSNPVTISTIGVYKVIVTDAAGCVVADDTSATKYLIVQPAFSFSLNTTNSSCNNNNGAISIGTISGTASSPLSYLWDNGATSSSNTNLGAGYYNLTITDNVGCTASSNASVVNNLPSVTIGTITQSSCNSATGSATVTPSGGIAPYTITWNTAPVQTGTTLSNVLAGHYFGTVTDNIGCSDTFSVIIPNNNTVSGGLLPSNATCAQSNGSITSIISGGISPYTYQWSNGSASSNITGVSSGNYWLVVTDANGCTQNFTTFLHSTNNLSITHSVSPASCIYATDGSESVTVLGATPPLTEIWSNGATTSSINNVAPGTYVYYITDALGCSLTDTSIINYLNGTSCYCTVDGYVFQDANNNCIKDLTEQTLPFVQVHLAPFGYAYTDATGYYFFHVPSGSYTLSETAPNYYPLQSCQSNSIPVNASATAGCVISNDFANSITPTHDLKINTWGSNAVPGQNHQQLITVTNNGTYNESSIAISYNDDGLLGATSFNPPVFSQPNSVLYPNWYLENNSLPSITPTQSTFIYAIHSVPTSLSLGSVSILEDTIAYQLPINNWISDGNANDNINNVATNVVASFDPNYKEVYPKGIGNTGDIGIADSILTYFVHFQNEGTFYAFNVVVIDTLDSNLNWATLKPIANSANMNIEISENGIAKFKFQNIMLPWKSFDDISSQGMFSYTIHTKHNLAFGTQFKNSASIYFDYNIPVKTNTTINTLSNKVGINQANINDDNLFVVYPNPTSKKITVQFNKIETKIKNISISTMMGSTISNININHSNYNSEHEFDISSLSKGIYFLIVKTIDGRTYYKKFTVQ